MIDWNALTKKQQQIVIVTAALVGLQLLVLVFFVGFGKASGKRGTALKAEMAGLQQKIDGARIVLAREAAVKTELDESIAKLEKMGVYIPSASDRYAWAYEYISRRAAEAGVVIDNVEEQVFRPRAGGNQPASDAYEISVSTRCGYSRLIEFIWRLEKDNPLMRVKELSVSAIPDTPQSHQVRFTLQWPSALAIEKGAR